MHGPNTDPGCPCPLIRASLNPLIPQVGHTSAAIVTAGKAGLLSQVRQGGPHLRLSSSQAPDNLWSTVSPPSRHHRRKNLTFCLDLNVLNTPEERASSCLLLLTAAFKGAVARRGWSTEQKRSIQFDPEKHDLHEVKKKKKNLNRALCWKGRKSLNIAFWRKEAHHRPINQSIRGDLSGIKLSPLFAVTMPTDSFSRLLRHVF